MISGAILLKQFAYAKIFGNSSNPSLFGTAYFHESPLGGTWVEVEVNGLPDGNLPDGSSFYGMHIHENGNCSLPFDKTGEHYNPTGMTHPKHVGDLPPLLGNNGYAYMFFYTDRFDVRDIIHKSIVIHSSADDFTSQLSGNAGSKIGCGVIRRYLP